MHTNAAAPTAIIRSRPTRNPSAVAARTKAPRPRAAQTCRMNGAAPGGPRHGPGAGPSGTGICWRERGRASDQSLASRRAALETDGLAVQHHHDERGRDQSHAGARNKGRDDHQPQSRPLIARCYTWLTYTGISPASDGLRAATEALLAWWPCTEAEDLRWPCAPPSRRS
jgi:hypothetical protein